MNSRCRFTEVVIYRPNDGFLCEENGTTAPCSYRVLSYSLAVCAATLEQAGIRIQVLDAGAERLSTVDALRRIASIRPKILIISVNNFAAGLALKGVEALKESLEPACTRSPDPRSRGRMPALLPFHRCRHSKGMERSQR